MAWTTINTGDRMIKSERIGSEADLEAIDRVRDAHIAALNAGDAEAWVAQFTDDGVQMPPTRPQMSAGR